MRIAKNKKIYLALGILIIILCAIGLKNYSAMLRQEGTRELLGAKNRGVAIAKIRLAQTVWPFLKFDQTYQKSLMGLKEIEQRPAIVIYLKPNTNTSDINNLVKEIQAIQGVQQVKYISPEESLKSYKETVKNESLLLKMAPTSFSTQSMDVYLNDFTFRSQVEKAAKDKSYVTIVDQLI